MPITPPAENLLARAPMELPDLFGRMRSLTEDAGFSGVLPAIWQCSDESQGIKKALFGYYFDCPVFNLGRVGALLDPNRLQPAAHHGRDLVILGGSHLGATEEDGIGMVQRVHGEVAPCCGKLLQVFWEYLQVYRRAAALITLAQGSAGFEIEIPYKYLFRKQPAEAPRIQLQRQRLVEGEALREGCRGKVFKLHPALQAREVQTLARLGPEAEPIGSLLTADTFTFTKRLDPESLDPLAMIEFSLFDFMPDIVTSRHPHRRLADVNTWRQFHRLASYLTDFFDAGERNILVVAGLTLDHSIRHNTFIPQFAFRLEEGQRERCRYYGPEALGELLAAQRINRPQKTFLQYAGIES